MSSIAAQALRKRHQFGKKHRLATGQNHMLKASRVHLSNDLVYRKIFADRFPRGVGRVAEVTT
jgi:hypothetical protein